MLDFTESLFKDLIEKAKSTNEEICGFVLHSGEILECKNIAEDPVATFMISPIDYLKNKKEIAAIYHSHPEGLEPSEEDKICCKRINLPFLIISLPDTVYYMTPKEDTCLQFDCMDI